MKILFLADPYLDLYKTILAELVELNHDVYCLLEPALKNDPYFKKSNRIKRLINQYRWNRDKTLLRYWEHKILTDSCILSGYDLLFCIQGCTFHPYLLQQLRTINPLIKSTLYIWDSNRYYNFFRNVDWFDKVFSFDLYDVEKYGKNKVVYLPFFWPKCIDTLSLETCFKVFSVGTNHDDRNYIYKRIINQLENEGISYFIKLVSIVKHASLWDSLKLCLYKLFLCKSKVESLSITYGLTKPDHVFGVFFSIDEYIKLLMQSECVLDTDRKVQGGLTPRLMWALAANKRIFTTNCGIVNIPFYSRVSMHIISRTNPFLDIGLISSNESIDTRKLVLQFRIDNWIKKIL